MNCPNIINEETNEICNKDDWHLEKRTRNMYFYNVYVCNYCRYERLPTPQEKENFNG